MAKKIFAFLAMPFRHTLLFLAAVLAFFELTDLDQRIQDFFYNPVTRAWLMPPPAAAPWTKLVFYLGPKVCIIVLAVVLLVLALLPTRWRSRLPWPLPCWPRTALLCVVLTLATAPLLVSVLKATTNIHYPCNTERYGGSVPYVRLFEKFPEGTRPEKRSRGFPAGHASGGFALMSLCCLAATRAGRRAFVCLGLGVGWIMGFYQMLRGLHYISHTIISMLLCWLVFLFWHWVLVRLWKALVISKEGEPLASTV